PHIYVADWANHRIVRLDDMQGRNWTTFGEGNDRERQFHFPVAIVVDAVGRIYVTEQRHHRLTRMDDLSGGHWTTFTRQGNEGEAVNKYAGSWVFVDERGRIYLTYDGRHRVVRVDDMSGTNWIAF